MAQSVCIRNLKRGFALYSPCGFRSDNGPFAPLNSRFSRRRPLLKPTYKYKLFPSPSFRLNSFSASATIDVLLISTSRQNRSRPQLLQPAVRKYPRTASTRTCKTAARDETRECSMQKSTLLPVRTPDPPLETENCSSSCPTLQFGRRLDRVSKNCTCLPACTAHYPKAPHRQRCECESHLKWTTSSAHSDGSHLVTSIWGKLLNSSFHLLFS